MEASVVDLRYRMKDVLQALDRNEEVKVLHRGTVKGVIVPNTSKKKLRVADHPLFGSDKTSVPTVDEVIDELRGGRFGAL